MKKFYIQFNIGKAKYVVNYYDGEKKNRDSSQFWDIKIFSNRKKMDSFIDTLLIEGYREIK